MSPQGFGVCEEMFIPGRHPTLLHLPWGDGEGPHRPMQRPREWQVPCVAAKEVSGPEVAGSGGETRQSPLNSDSPT